MNYEELSLSGFIKEIKEVSDGTHPRKFCFVLGAGASRSSGIKSGQDLVKIWDIELRERNINEYNAWRNEIGITDDNMYSFYSRYYEKRFKRSPSDGYNYIEKIMSSAKPSAGYVMLAYILTRSKHNIVVTTNFDHLTEDAVNYYAQETPLVIGHEFLSHYISANPVRPTIIKIHRDLLFDPKSRSEDLEKLADNWKSSLGLVFENYHPIFVGYAGNDNSLMNFLLENASKFASDEWKYPYWMLYEDDELDGKILEFVTNSRGYVIYHTGFDDVLIQLGAAFNYQMPPEEIFLKDAKKRYKSLVDSIDAFSEKSKKSEKPEVEVVIEKASKILEVTDTSNSSKEGKIAVEKIAGQSEMMQQYRLAITEMEKENFEKAEELLLNLLKEDPDNIRYIRRYGMVLFEQEKFNDALTQFDKAVILAPEDELSHFWRGTVLSEIGENEVALSELLKACELKPEDDFNQFSKGCVLEELMRYDEALEAYKLAIELDSSEDLYYFKMGYLLKKLKRYEEARDLFATAVEIAPEDDMYNYELGFVYEELEEYEKALESYEKAAELDPGDATNHFKAGNMFEKLKQYEKALAEYQQAVELKPKVAVHHLALANAFSELEQYDEAIEEYNKALSLDEKMDVCYWRLAQLYNKLGKYDDALVYIKTAIDINGNIWEYYETKARICANLKMINEANEAFDKMSELMNV